MEEYTRRMVSSRCDGDYITLQALCDALKVYGLRGKEIVFYYVPVSLLFSTPAAVRVAVTAFVPFRFVSFRGI